MPPTVIDDLAQMIAWPTVSNRPLTALAAHLADGARDLGFRVEMMAAEEAGKANVVCRAGPDDAEDGLIISGHMDVVPTEGQPWSSDPFQLTEREGRLHGRGTADMKGFIAATMTALRRLRGHPVRRPLALIWTHDEEVGCLGSRNLIPLLADRPLPAEALIGEPTDFRILRMHPGHVGVTIETTGRAAHSSKPDLGASAISAMGRVLGMLERLAVDLQRERRLEEHLERPWVTMNPGVLQGGQAINIVADRCALQVGYRPLPGDDPLDVSQQIRARLGELNLPAGTAATLRVDRVTPALHTPSGQPLANTLRPHACPSDQQAAAFATDGGNLQELGIRSLIFGPGSIDVAHRADEYVETRGLLRAVDVGEQVVRERCL